MLCFLIYMFLYRLCLGVALAEVDAKTSECVEVPVWVVCVLGIVLVGSDVGITLDHDADRLALVIG